MRSALVVAPSPSGSRESPIIEKLNREIVRISRLPEAREQFAAQCADPVGMQSSKVRE